MSLLRNEQFRLALEAAPTGMLIVNGQGLLVLVNRQAEILFGYRRDELLGKPVEILVPARFEKHHSLRGFFQSDPRTRVMGAGRELFALRKDGSEVPVEIGLNPLPTDEGHFVLCSVVDITERTRAMQQFRLAIEASPTGMLMVAGDGRIVLVNAQVERMFGYTRDELIGARVDTLVPERFRARHPEYRASFGAAPQIRPMGAGRDLFGLRKDGTEIPIEIALNPLHTADGDFVLSSVVDITERKAAERERAKLVEQMRDLNTQLEARIRDRTAELTTMLREREVLLQEVHHRVKNNLQVISSLINMQMRKLEDAGTRAALEECQTRVLAIALIHEKLYQAKDYARVPFADYVHSLASDIMQATGVSPDRAKLEFSIVRVPLRVDIAIPCGLVINELIMNALKHGLRSDRPTTIRVEFSEIEGHRYRLAVSDDGPGLPAGFDISRDTSMGLRLVATLADQLDATLNVATSGGGRFVLEFARG